MSGTVPIPTPIYRIVHIDNLDVFLHRNALHSPLHQPKDGHQLRYIHNPSIQSHRRVTRVPCGPGSYVHDYVPFYFGPRSPMLYQLNTPGAVEGYFEGQEPIIYLVSSVQSVATANRPFVFTDGHAIAGFTLWFDRLNDLDKVDWQIAYAKFWFDDAENPDRKRKKQAEFLVYECLEWNTIEEIGVCNLEFKKRVLRILADHPRRSQPPVKIRSAWYY